jgi:2-polyprenyl-3-methyl-5-hydroxy-6-metoxy-1,4-benzoquinol methylase
VLSEIGEINRRQHWAEQSIALDRHSLYREVGCLDGRYLARLRERGWSVHGIDIQPQEPNHIVLHDAANPFPFGEQFDLVIAAEVVEHIVDTDAFLDHCAAVLKPGGVFILTTPNLLFGVNRVLMLLGKRPRFAYADYHVRMFVWDDLRAHIARKFVIRRVQGSHVLLGLRHSMLFLPFAVLGDYLPTLSAHFIVTAEKPVNER